MKNPQIVINLLDNNDYEAYIGKKEFSIEGKSVDVIFAAKRGNIYIIETKLYKNLRYREAVTQVLEYASLIYKAANSDIDRLINELGLSLILVMN